MSAPKRKRLEKTPQEEEQNERRYRCVMCGTNYSRQKGFFSVSHAPMYRATGYLPYCYECVDKQFNYYREKLGSDRAAVRRMCMKLDLYWSDSLYNEVVKLAGGKSLVRTYITRVNVYRHIDKTFDTTLEEEAARLKEYNGDPSAATPNDAAVEELMLKDEAQKVVQRPKFVEIDISDETRMFWGPGYSDEQYAELEGRRKYWMSKYPEGTILDIGEEALLRQICSLEIDINHDRSAGRPVNNNVNTLNTLIGSANLKPAQKKVDVDTELEKMPLGVGIQKWEYNRPLPQTERNKCDIRGTIKNITTWYLGHACKMVGLRNSYCKMYEDAMDELRVKNPEYDEEDDDSVLSDLFGAIDTGGGS